MCLGITGRVVELVEGYGDQLARVDVMGRTREINIGMLEDGPPTPGDWVMIHMGFALERLDEQQVTEVMEGLEMMRGPAGDGG
ncbi:MAG: HypC/HybG/HupF family hydrogenase formation chaperone [Marmoricola sp.]